MWLLWNQVFGWLFFFRTSEANAFHAVCLRVSTWSTHDISFSWFEDCQHSRYESSSCNRGNIRSSLILITGNALLTLDLIIINHFVSRLQSDNHLLELSLRDQVSSSLSFIYHSLSFNFEHCRFWKDQDCAVFFPVFIWCELFDWMEVSSTTTASESWLRWLAR